MQIKCDYCGNYIPDSEPVCPNCGAPNNGVKRTSDEVPHTIEGLKEYVREQTDSSQPYILDRCQRFPCFDAEDYANEYRFYRNFLVCRDKQEANRKAKQMEKLPHFSDFCLVTNELPDTMRPMVYYKDETMEMTLAY